MRILCIYFVRYQENSHSENSHPENFHQSNSAWWIPPEKVKSTKFLPGIFPPMFLNILTRVFSTFFNYCDHYHWHYLNKCFVILCFKSAEVFLFVKICQSKVLSELERRLMKWLGIFQLRNFWVAIFQGGIPIFRVGIPSWGLSWKHFLHIMYLFYFSKDYQQIKWNF